METFEEIVPEKVQPQQDGPLVKPSLTATVTGRERAQRVLAVPKLKHHLYPPGHRSADARQQHGEGGPETWQCWWTDEPMEVRPPGNRRCDDGEVKGSIRDSWGLIVVEHVHVYGIPVYLTLGYMEYTNLFHEHEIASWFAGFQFITALHISSSRFVNRVAGWTSKSTRNHRPLHIYIYKIILRTCSQICICTSVYAHMRKPSCLKIHTHMRTPRSVYSITFH